MRFWIKWVSLAVVLAASLTLLKVVADSPEKAIYSAVAGEQLAMDVYRPASRSGIHPGLILVHGGGWATGSRKDFGDLARGLTTRGFVCFSPDYRLVHNGLNRYPAALDDVQRCVRFIRAHASEYQVDPQRIGAIGASAGGQLVALLGTRETRDNQPPELAAYSSKVRCVVDLFGPADFTHPLGNTPGLDGPAIVADFLGKGPAEGPAVYREASPVTYASATSAPFLILQGLEDPVVLPEQSRLMAAALRSRGVFVKLVEYPGEGHGIQQPLHKENAVLEMVRFLNQYLGN